MDYSLQIQAVIARVNELIAAEPDLFLVEVKIKPTNNIKVFIDGDLGVSIDRLIQYNRKLYKQLEESALFPNGDFSLEVSSPGLEEPLKLHRQYIKNTGRYIEVFTTDGVKREGKLLNAAEDKITMEETIGKGKKAEIKTHVIPFEQIKTTKIQIKF
jgi:ribosome maturation factor RimP